MEADTDPHVTDVSEFIRQSENYLRHPIERSPGCFRIAHFLVQSIACVWSFVGCKSKSVFVLGLSGQSRANPVLLNREPCALSPFGILLIDHTLIVRTKCEKASGQRRSDSTPATAALRIHSMCS